MIQKSGYELQLQLKPIVRAKVIGLDPGTIARVEKENIKGSFNNKTVERVEAFISSQEVGL